MGSPSVLPPPQAASLLLRMAVSLLLWHVAACANCTNPYATNANLGEPCEFLPQMGTDPDCTRNRIPVRAFVSASQPLMWTVCRAGSACAEEEIKHLSQRTSLVPLGNSNITLCLLPGENTLHFLKGDGTVVVQTLGCPGATSACYNNDCRHRYNQYTFFVGCGSGADDGGGTDDGDSGQDMTPVSKWLLIVLGMAGVTLLGAVVFQACTLKHDRTAVLADSDSHTQLLNSGAPSIYDARMSASLRGTANDPPIMPPPRPAGDI